ncbi:MAG: molybdopterin-guanine dinucleotide biosynthesis protein MobB [Gammaproteobacteria bacterium]|nr:molybdopterin-guanine dinucleotide biosynthesis protein MobB [Gammaproteobacteria bacterium]
MIQSPVPVLGFAAWSGTGKTTLLKQLIPLLKDKGICIGMIKHAHHNFDIDKPGKDSYELRKAGADQMLIASQRRWALMVETPELDGDPDLNKIIEQLDYSRLDLILVEGFKHVSFPKIELYRPSVGKETLFSQDTSIIAIATDSPTSITTSLPVLNINIPASIADFITDYLDQAGSSASAER